MSEALKEFDDALDALGQSVRAQNIDGVRNHVRDACDALAQIGQEDEAFVTYLHDLRSDVENARRILGELGQEVDDLLGQYSDID